MILWEGSSTNGGSAPHSGCAKWEVSFAVYGLLFEAMILDMLTGKLRRAGWFP